MKYDVIAFDLQGTLSDSSFSDKFWMKVLPELYAQNKNIPLTKAREELKKKFKEYGKYDYRYYSMDYWLKELNLKLKFKDICKLIKSKPYFYRDSLKLIKKLGKKNILIVISSTTKEFINAELGKNKKCFKYIFSSIDDFDIAGKPKELYLKIAKILKTNPHKIIYIGNDTEMDIRNARLAGYNTFFFDNDKARKENMSKLSEIIEEKK